MPHGVQHPTHNAITPLVQGQLDHGLAVSGAEEFEIVDLGGAVGEFHTVAQLSAKTARYVSGDRGDVRLGHLVGRVHEAVRQLPVIGQQDQSDGFGIETTDIADALVAAHPLFDQLPDARAATVVRHGREHPVRLVECQIHQLGVHDHPRTVDANHVDGGIDSPALLGDDLAIHLHATVENHPLSDPA